MASTGNIGYGGKFEQSADGAAYSTIAQVENVTGPDISVKPVQITNLDSPGAAVGAVKQVYHEKVPGIADGGQWTLTVIYTKAVLNALAALVRLPRFFRHTDADGGVCTAPGFITKISKGAALDDRETIDLTIEVSGAPTFA